MAKFMWASWDGGGNLAPSLGIARALSERGHSVEFLGRRLRTPKWSKSGVLASLFPVTLILFKSE